MYCVSAGGGSRNEAKELRRQHTWLKKLNRLVHFKLVIPLMRSPHPPEYTARGVMIGLFWAMTPLIGVQMYLVLLSWLIARRKSNWDFSLLIGLAWTWVTNVFTMIPTYYLFYVTGQILLGRGHAIKAYDHFAHAWEAALEAEGYLRPIVAYIRTIASEQGVPMAIGSIPYAFGLSWIGYRWSLKFIIGLRKARHERKARKQRDAAAKGERQEAAIERQESVVMERADNA